MRRALVLLAALHFAAGDVVTLQAQRAAVEAARLEAIAAAEAAQAAADILLAQQEATRLAAIKRAKEKKAAAATLARTAEEVAKMNPYSIARSSYKFHVTNKFFVKPRAAQRFCMTLPTVDTPLGFRNGLAVFMAPCNASDSSQLFSYDPVSKYIHPETSTKFCLDFEFDNKNLRPLTVFRCDKTFSGAAKARHQEWELFNSSNIKNYGTGKCIAMGKKEKVYEGKAVQQYSCANIKEQMWNWVPLQWYRAQNMGRTGWNV